MGLLKFEIYVAEVTYSFALTPAVGQRHFFAIKLGTGTGQVARSPTCVNCNQGVATINEGECFIRQVCFEDDEFAFSKFGRVAAKQQCDASYSQTELKGEPLNPICDICGGGNLTKPDEIISVEGLGSDTCVRIYGASLGGVILGNLPNSVPLEFDCAFLQGLAKETCGCTDPPTEAPTMAPTKAPTMAPTKASQSISESSENDGGLSGGADEDGGLSGGAIGGIVAAAVVVLVVIVGIVVKSKGYDSGVIDSAKGGHIERGDEEAVASQTDSQAQGSSVDHAHDQPGP